MPPYNFKDIEIKWQTRWKERGCFRTPPPTAERKPYHMLVMFPYPSGHLHMGHVRNYTIGDVLARFYRARGRAVMHPIGWDAFGLPAENAAIERGVPPSKWTWDNIRHMGGQLRALGISYDWEREFATCDPNYYRWNQWIFIKMFERGLAYRKKAPVNWCPKDQTVLANEQAQDNRCWRCGTEVEQKELEQWFFKITDYAGQLLKDHEQLTPASQRKGWPPEVLTMQRNWIGASNGATVDFPVLSAGRKTGEKITVFTTRPDTLFGATFMVLAPEHPLVDKVTTPERKERVQAYRENARKLSKITRTSAERDKTGEFTGAYVENPVNGQPVPVWIADYVMIDYGTGAIMAVPAHDERDFAFAQKFNIPVVQVIQNPGKPIPHPMREAFTEDGVMINSGRFNGMPSEGAKQEIARELASKGQGAATVTYKLRDWLLSRQRYWGTPIPVVYCESCGAVPVALDDLPVRLPENVTFSGKGASPLTQDKNWLQTPCPKCRKTARRETDTMDTFVDSSWYYARYTDPHNAERPFDKAAADAWLPVHQYVGGIEHACMHLIYARFFHKVLRDLGLLTSDEPFGSLLTQGMVTLGGSAMSKSKGNVVDPSSVIDRYGADACRLFILFAAPPTQQLEWSDKQVEGVWRFLNRVWRLAGVFVHDEDATALKRSSIQDSNVTSDEIQRAMNVTVQRVTEDIERDFGFNTAIAAVMELVNKLYVYPNLGDDVSRVATEAVIRLLAPFAPHTSEELWELLGHREDLAGHPWPSVDASKLEANHLQIVVQVNGKLRDRVVVPANAVEEEVKRLAQSALETKGMKISPQRVIYVPRKLINFVENGRS